MVADVVNRLHADLNADWLAAIIDSSDDAIISKDLNGVITSWNPGAQRLFGYSPEEIIGKSVLILIPPERHEEEPRILERMRRGERIEHYETVRRRKDGKLIDVSLSTSPIRDTEGKVVGVSKIARDITGRKRAGEISQRLASIVESSDDAIISKDLDGIILSWNQGAQRLFGYAAGEVIGKPVTILIPPDRAGEEPQILERIRRGEKTEHFETVRRRKDGSLVDISLSISPIRNADGNVIGASKIARDITVQKRASEQQALIVQEMRHRIKNTIATVQAMAGQTLRALSDEDRRAYFARLHALASAHDLLADENWNRTSLSDLIERILDVFIEAYRGRIILEGPTDIRLNADLSCMLAMVLHELVTNAVKYGALSNASGQVRLTWQIVSDKDRQKVRLIWRETGGPPVVQASRKGFGSMLIQHAFSGDRGKSALEFAPTGVICTFEVSL